MASARTKAMTSPVRPKSDPASTTKAESPPSNSAVFRPFTPRSSSRQVPGERVITGWCSALPAAQVHRPGVEHLVAAHDVEAFVQRDGRVDVRGHHPHRVTDAERL